MAYTELLIYGMFIGGMLFWIFSKFWNILQNKKWSILVPIFVQRGNSIIFDKDERGRLIKSPLGYSVIKLKGRKDHVKPPKYDTLTISKNAESVYPLFMTATGQYFPLKSVLPKFEFKKLTKEELQKDPKLMEKLLDAANGKMIPIRMITPPSVDIVEDKSATNWAVLERKRIFDKFKPDEGWFAKYGQFMMNTLFMAVIIFVIIFMMTKFEVISSSIQGAGAAFEDAAKRLSSSGVTSQPSSPSTNMTVVP